jgi:hypothetical protein
MAREQHTVELNQARNTQCELEEAHRVNIKDLAKLGRAINTVMAGLGMSLGPDASADTLVEPGMEHPVPIRLLKKSDASRM